MASPSPSHNCSNASSEPHACATCRAPRTPRRCRYAGKKCRNTRATKRNGSMHTLCDHHRLRANQNQRRMAQRTRQVHAEAVLLARMSAPTQPMNSYGSCSPQCPQTGELLDVASPSPLSPPPAFDWKEHHASQSAFGDEYSLQDLMSSVPHHTSNHVWSDHDVFMALQAVAQASAWPERESDDSSRNERR
ncbi:hypothetical protein Gpo141_00012487 [Globisporangium polare]